MLGEHMLLFVYSTFRHERKDDTVKFRVRNTLDTMLVDWESSIIVVVVMVFAQIIVTVDCEVSVYSMRKRRLWDSNAIQKIIKSTRVVQEFDKRLQTNFKNRDVDESKMMYPLKNATTEFMWIFATTCYEYFVDILIEYVSTAATLIATSIIDVIDEETITSIRFVDDDIYCMPTLLFDVGHRNIETILQTIHLLRTLKFSYQGKLVTASELKKKLQKFVSDYSLKPMKKMVESGEWTVVGRLGVKMECQKIKNKLTKISKILRLNNTPFINTHFFDHNISYSSTNTFLSFNDYIYETEKCIVHVSIRYVFLVI